MPEKLETDHLSELQAIIEARKPIKFTLVGTAFVDFFTSLDVSLLMDKKITDVSDIVAVIRHLSGIMAKSLPNDAKEINNFVENVYKLKEQEKSGASKEVLRETREEMLKNLDIIVKIFNKLKFGGLLDKDLLLIPEILSKLQINELQFKIDRDITLLIPKTQRQRSAIMEEPPALPHFSEEDLKEFRNRRKIQEEQEVLRTQKEDGSLVSADIVDDRFIDPGAMIIEEIMRNMDQNIIRLAYLAYNSINGKFWNEIIKEEKSLILMRGEEEIGGDFFNFLNYMVKNKKDEFFIKSPAVQNFLKLLKGEEISEDDVSILNNLIKFFNVYTLSHDKIPCIKKITEALENIQGLEFVRQTEAEQMQLRQERCVSVSLPLPQNRVDDVFVRTQSLSVLVNNDSDLATSTTDIDELGNEEIYKRLSYYVSAINSGKILNKIEVNIFRKLVKKRSEKDDEVGKICRIINKKWRFLKNNKENLLSIKPECEKLGELFVKIEKNEEIGIKLCSPENNFTIGAILRLESIIKQGKDIDSIEELELFEERFDALREKGLEKRTKNTITLQEIESYINLVLQIDPIDQMKSDRMGAVYKAISSISIHLKNPKDKDFFERQIDRITHSKYFKKELLAPHIMKNFSMFQNELDSLIQKIKDEKSIDAIEENKKKVRLNFEEAKSTLVRFIRLVKMTEGGLENVPFITDAVGDILFVKDNKSIYENKYGESIEKLFNSFYSCLQIRNKNGEMVFPEIKKELQIFIDCANLSPEPIKSKLLKICEKISNSEKDIERSSVVAEEESSPLLLSRRGSTSPLTPPPPLTLPPSYQRSSVSVNPVRQQVSTTTRIAQERQELLTSRSETLEKLETTLRETELVKKRKEQLIDEIKRGKRVFDDENFSKINFRLVLSELGFNSLDGFTFNNCNFDEANFYTIQKITNCKFNNSSFNLTNFSKMEILWCKFNDCKNFNGANFFGTKIKESSFHGCNLRGLDIRKGFFEKCKLFACKLFGIKTTHNLFGNPFKGCQIDKETKISAKGDKFLSAQLPLVTTSLERQLKKDKEKESEKQSMFHSQEKNLKQYDDIQIDSKVEKIKISSDSSKIIKFIQLQLERGYSQLPSKSIIIFGENISNDLVNAKSQDLNTLFMVSTSFANGFPISDELREEFDKIKDRQINLGKLKIIYEISEKIIKIMDKQNVQSSYVSKRGHSHNRRDFVALSA